ncbi:hypothetical protein [Croceibacterium ferulae]|uniref:hypothetical protein n=1 Tax=Croceibacterium ferulae TaxID=1854641 RepID=UPI000EB470E4|nr:hypothetical protein [Croceibacterium ferulae]
MTERNPHPDNDLIDQITDGGAAPAQGSRSRGSLRGDVGTRAELDRALGDDHGKTSVRGSDNPAQDEMKGAKTIDALRSDGQG